MKLEAKGGFQATKKQPKYAPAVRFSYSYVDHRSYARHASAAAHNSLLALSVQVKVVKMFRQMRGVCAL